MILPLTVLSGTIFLIVSEWLGIEGTSTPIVSGIGYRFGFVKVNIVERKGKVPLNWDPLKTK